MKLDRTEIEFRVPHSGAMCLLDAVTYWDTNCIVCSAVFSDLEHPLSRDGKLPATTAVEYAAQATAVHGALLGGQRVARPGVLAKLKDVTLEHEFIVQEESPLTVWARLLDQTDTACLYSFEMSGSLNLIATGQLMVAFSSVEHQR